MIFPGASAGAQARDRSGAVRPGGDQLRGLRKRLAVGGVLAAVTMPETSGHASAELRVHAGPVATGLKAIAEAGEATTGSLYHFFPNGKSELAASTLRNSGDHYVQIVFSVFDAAPDPVSAVRDCFEGAAEVLRLGDYADACPIATVALEVASSDEPLRQVTNEIFQGWLASAAQHFEAGGIEPDPARDLATMFIAALEGGFLLSRVAKDASALETVGRSVVALVKVAVATGSTSATPGRSVR